jgi:hypothetical protein
METGGTCAWALINENLIKTAETMPSKAKMTVVLS